MIRRSRKFKTSRMRKWVNWKLVHCCVSTNIRFSPSSPLSFLPHLYFVTTVFHLRRPREQPPPVFLLLKRINLALSPLFSFHYCLYHSVEFNFWYSLPLDHCYIDGSANKNGKKIIESVEVGFFRVRMRIARCRWPCSTIPVLVKRFVHSLSERKLRNSLVFW